MLCFLVDPVFGFLVVFDLELVVLAFRFLGGFFSFSGCLSQVVCFSFFLLRRFKQDRLVNPEPQTSHTKSLGLTAVVCLR